MKRKKINSVLVCISRSFIFTAYDVAIVIIVINITCHFSSFTTRDVLILFLVMKYTGDVYSHI